MNLSGLTDAIQSQIGKAGEGLAKAAGQLKDQFSNAAEGLAKEAEIGPRLHEEAIAALHLMQHADAGLKKMVEDAYAFAVFPSVARASLALGVTFGKGEVFEKRDVVGYAGMVQITVGVQLGGQTMHALVVMESEDALKRFKAGEISFAANASAAIVKAGAAASRSPSGMRIFLYSEGGEMLEATLGGQTFRFKPAALGRLRKAE